MRLTPVVLLVSLASIAAGAEAPVPFTERERAQGFSDRIVLAKPRVRERGGAETAEAAERRAGVRVREKFLRLADLRVVEVESAESVAAALTRLRATGLYEFVEPDYIMTYDATPNDPAFATTQWSLNNTGQLAASTPGADIKAPAAWDLVSGASAVVVAIMDTGVLATHEDIAANLWRNPAPTVGDVNGIRIVNGVRSGDLSDDLGHGSHVAGIVGAAGNNGVGIAGIAWQVQLMILKNGAATGSLTSDSAACLDYAVARGAQIVNCSFGGAGFSQTFFTALKAARDAGVIVVTSAGNAGVSNDLAPHFPSNYLLDNIVSAGNSGPTDVPSASSDFGALVELFAPGSSINSLSNAGPSAYAVRSGTSMAAPHVTGALALLKARFPADNHRQLINRLLRGTDRKAAFSGRALTGGRLNLFGALTSTSNRPFNDDFAARAIVTGTAATTRTNNTGATAEAGEPAHATATAGASL